MANPGGVEKPCGPLAPKGCSQISGDLRMHSLGRLVFGVSGLSETNGLMLFSKAGLPAMPRGPLYPLIPSVIGWFHRKLALRPSVSCRMFTQSALGISVCGRAGKETEVGRGRSRISIQVQGQPTTAHRKLYSRLVLLSCLELVKMTRFYSSMEMSRWA